MELPVTSEGGEGVLLQGGGEEGIFDGSENTKFIAHDIRSRRKGLLASRNRIRPPSGLGLSAPEDFQGSLLLFPSSTKQLHKQFPNYIFCSLSFTDQKAKQHYTRCLIPSPQKKMMSYSKWCKSYHLNLLF